jgi:hypothetical protein
MLAAWRQGITVWVSRSDGDLARLIMVRLGVIEPTPAVKERVLAVRRDMHGPVRPQS